MDHSEIIRKKHADAVQGMDAQLFLSGKKWFDHVMNLPFDLCATYLVAIMHQQVVNGGFHQYFTNRYGQFSHDTIKVLRKIGASHSAKLLEQALELVNSEHFTEKKFREKLWVGDIPELFVSDSLADPLSKLDDEYWNSTEDLEQLLVVIYTR